MIKSGKGYMSLFLILILILAVFTAAIPSFGFLKDKIKEYEDDCDFDDDDECEE